MHPQRSAQSVQLRYDQRRVAISGDNEQATAWLVEFLHPAFERAAPGLDDCFVRLVIDPQLHQSLAQVRVTATPSKVDCFTLDGSFAPGLAIECSELGRWVFDPRHDAYYHVSASGKETQVLVREDTKPSRFALMRVVRETSTAAELHLGRLPVHGAAFLAGSHTILVSGPKRSGKTSFLIWALMCGAKFLSNDRVQVDLSPTEPIARGMPTIVKIRPGALMFFPQLRRALKTGRYRWYRTIEECRAGILSLRDGPCDDRSSSGLSGRQFCEVLGVKAVASAPLGAIVFPTVRPNAMGMRLSRLSQAGALERLARGIMKPGICQKASQVFGGEAASLTVSPKTELKRCRELTARVPCFECILGTNAYHAELSTLFRREGIGEPWGKAA